MGWVVRPSDAACADEHVAGGKGASLARVARLGANVPSFVVVAADAHRAFAKSGPSGELLVELRAALSEFDLAAGVAVRSSAIGEDAADSSFAGLYQTVLDVRSFHAVVEAIGVCWASFSDAAAAAYREGRAGVHDAAMAVVIQEMVHGEWSGVAFTANPVSLALSEAVINATRGLGEALVSGEVNPEEITLDAATGRVLRRQAGEGGASLPNEAVESVWRAARSLEEQLAFPQDVEWAWRDGQLFVLQSRPITTIADVFYSRVLEPWRDDPEAEPDAPDRIWSRMLADETWVSPISPLFYNIHNSTPGRVRFFHYHGDRAKLPPDMFKYHRATAYCDVRVIRRMYEYQPRMARIRGVQNFLPDEMQPAFREAPWRMVGRLRRIIEHETNDRAARGFFRNWRYVQGQWPAFLETASRWPQLDLEALPLEELRAHHAAVRATHAAVGPACAIAVLSHAADLHMLLTGLLERWAARPGSSGEELYARVSQGLENSETLKVAETLWRLGQQLRALGPPLADAASWPAFQAVAKRKPEAEGLAHEIEAFHQAHPHLGSTYKDLIWPRWGDDIEPLFQAIKGYAGSTARRPSEVNAVSARQRREAQAEVLQSLRGPLAPLRRRILRWLFRQNEIYMAVRDDHRFYVDRNWYEMRRVYLAYGSHLVASGLLADRGEVFFLGTAEVDAGLAGALERTEVRRRIDVRRRVWQATLRAQGPKFLKGWAPYAETAASSGAAARRIEGIAASPGQAVGVARIVYDVRELAGVRDGDILVTRQTDPSWTTVFGRIGGLVLETGGVLSHGTSLCREYGLPCVTAVERATVRIPDGARVELIGSEGVIRILESA